jgi:hypothetical protein
MNRLPFVFGTVVGLSILGCEGQDQPQEPSNPTSIIFLQNNSSGTPGGKCKVVAGPNKGKEGTYDEDGSCCDEGPGGWGCTDCKDSDGNDNGKCKDVAKVSVITDFIDGDRLVMIDAYVQQPDGQVVRCVTSPLDAKSTICFPIPIEKLEDLLNSEDPFDRQVAQFIESSLTQPE